MRVTLTEQGRKIRAQAVPGRREVVCALGRTEEQIQALKRELDQLRDALLSQAEDAEDDVSREDAPTLMTPAEGQEPRSEKRARRA